MKINILTLGCKVNSYESDSIAQALTEKGYSVGQTLDYADLYIINTCAVTAEAEKKSRQMIARCLRYNKEAKIFVCGCASQNNAEQFKKDNVVLIKGVGGKGKIAQVIDQVGIFIDEIAKEYEDDLSPAFSKTRAYIKIQDGCNNFCSYCLIPYLRGRSRSRSIESVFDEVMRACQKTKEIVLTGINVSDYRVNGELALTQLINKLSTIKGLRLRFSSLEVNVITEELLAACKSIEGFCPHFHLSLQSGCDDTLKLMNRKYDTNQYYQKVELIRRNFENAAITTDLIVGYPTESEEHFDETLKFIDKVKFSDMHIFAYSSRKGTVASKLKTINPEIIKSRLERANRICDKNKKEYLDKFIGKQVSVLIEEFKNGEYVGYDKYYNRIHILEETCINQIVNVEVVSNNGEYCFGKLI